jgi:hypothetical protein
VKRNAICVLIACGALATGPAPAASADGDDELLGAWYQDPKTGVKFRPPAGCVFFGKPKARQVGRFVRSDRALMLTVGYEELGYRREIRAHLRKTVSVVQGRLRRIRMVGQTVFRVGVWPAGQWVGIQTAGGKAITHVQLLLQTDPQRVFVLTLRRAGADTREALRIMSAVAHSVSFSDTEDLAEQRTLALLAAKQLLGAAPEKLRRLELPEQRWMMLTHKDKRIGFTGLRVTREKVDGLDGYRICFRAYTDLNGAITIVDRTIETTEDLSVERWRQEVTMQAGLSGPVQTPRAQTGQASGGKCRVAHTQGKRRWTQQGPVPEGCFPLLLTEMFRRIVDVGDRQCYAFTYYDADARRTLPMSLRVEGRKPMNGRDGKEAYCFLRVLGNGLPPTRIWTDNLGTDLRYEAAGGVIGERASAGQVRRAFGSLAILRILDTGGGLGNS